MVGAGAGTGVPRTLLRNHCHEDDCHDEDAEVPRVISLEGLTDLEGLGLPIRRNPMVLDLSLFSGFVGLDFVELSGFTGSDFVKFASRESVS